MRSPSPISISFSFTAEWQADREALLLVTERDGPTMFTQIGVMRALNRKLGGS
jgi:hypothetical protein